MPNPAEDQIDNTLTKDKGSKFHSQWLKIK